MTVADYTNGFVLQEQAPQGRPSEAELTLREAFRSVGYREPEAAFEHGLAVLVAGTEPVVGYPLGV